MDEKIKTRLIENQKFNESRTAIGISFICQFCFVFIPGLLIWLFLGSDFQTLSFNRFLNLGSGKTWKILLIIIAYINLTLILSSISCILKWQKFDAFVFSLAISFAWTSVILNGLWINEWTTNSAVLKIIVRFVITILVVFIGLFLGTLLAALARNLSYKHELKKAAILATFSEVEPESEQSFDA